MNELKDLQNIWQSQATEAKNPDSILELAKKQKLHSIKKHVAGILVMGITSIIIFIFWLFFSFSSTMQLGLSLMFCSIFIRTLLEFYSFRRLKSINLSDKTEIYRANIIRFFRLRKILMSVVTTLAVLLYSTGFMLMLPEFKENLSRGMYIYIVVFLIIALPLSAFLLYRQAKVEFEHLSGVIDKLQ